MRNWLRQLWHRVRGTSQRRVSARSLEAIAALSSRLNQRRAQWEREDDEIRRLIAQASGSVNQDHLMRVLGLKRPRDLGEMAGKPIAGRFDAALTTDDNRLHWAAADALAADAAASPGVRWVLRNRARYEIANNCYARGVGETIANDFVGIGPRLHIEDERLTEDERTDIENKWLQWSYAINLAGKLRTMRKARRQDGEAFALKVTNPNIAHPIKLDLKLIEADQVRFVDVNLLTVPSVDGIRFDDYGNPASYHVLRVHPGYWSYATGFVGMPWEYDVWDAKYVIHWFRQDRPGQHRGLPEILPALPLYATLRRYTQAVLDAAETAADFAVLLETQAGAELVDEAGNVLSAEMANAFSSVIVPKRSITALPAGYTAKQMQPEQPTQSYREFKHEICGEIGRCEGVPLNVILADSSNSSFASGQLDHKIYYRTREIERREANTIILDNLLKDWIAEGVRIREGRGDMGRPYLPAPLRDWGIGVAHSWHWDSNELGDPIKLAAAKATELRNGIVNLPMLYAAKGKDWRKAFVAAARSLGITFEEYQALLRNSIYTQPDIQHATEARENTPPDTGMDTGTLKPGQGAMREALYG